MMASKCAKADVNVVINAAGAPLVIYHKTNR